MQNAIEDGTCLDDFKNKQGIIMRRRQIYTHYTVSLILINI